MRVAPVVAALALAAAACSGSRPRPASTASLPGAGAHDLVVEATSCWMGGLWSDALGETGNDRYAGIDRRCNALLRDVALSRADRSPGVASRMPLTPEDTYYPMRAVEPYVVEAIARSVQAKADQDPSQAPHAGRLVRLLRAVAAAARENVDARRAADRVKEDAQGPSSPQVRQDEKRTAAAKLERAEGLRDLFRADVGPYAAEARAIALLAALDRVEIARGLPKHLKIIAVGPAFREVFGVQPPPVPADAATPVRSGTWLAYLTEVAAAAGHPVPSDAHDPQNREPLAWTGTLAGFADRLRPEPLRPRLPMPLIAVERGVVDRLDREYRSEREAFEAHRAADR